MKKFEVQFTYDDNPTVLKEIVFTNDKKDALYLATRAFMYNHPQQHKEMTEGKSMSEVHVVKITTKRMTAEEKALMEKSRIQEKYEEVVHILEELLLDLEETDDFGHDTENGFELYQTHENARRYLFQHFGVRPRSASICKLLGI